MDIRHPQYLGTAPMNQSTEVTRAQGAERALESEEKGEVSCSQSSSEDWCHFGRSSEYQLNYN